MSHCLNTELSAGSTNGWKCDRSGKWLLIESETDFTLSISNTERRTLFSMLHMYKGKKETKMWKITTQRKMAEVRPKQTF